MTNTDTIMKNTTNTRNTRTPTIAEFKAWARDNRELAMTVCKAKAFAQVERERVDAYVAPIFARYGFTDDLSGTGEALTNPRDLYLSEDDARCAEFYAECDRAHREHGFTGREGYCPALVAEDLQCQAEQLLLNALGELMGVDGGDYNFTLEMRAKALDLALASCLGDLK